MISYMYIKNEIQMSREENKNEMIERIYGLYWGHLIGDAIGTRYEFEKQKNVIEKIKKDKNNNALLPILGGGCFRLQAGQFTDDGELTLCIWDTVDAGFTPQSIAYRFIAWYRSGAFDIGIATNTAFFNATNYDEITYNALQNESSLSNGCLMKISPLGYAGLYMDDITLRKTVEDVCGLTNPNILCKDACIGYIFAIREGLRTGDKNKAYSAGIQNMKIEENINMVLSPHPESYPLQFTQGGKIKYDEDHKGYYGIALRNAFWQLKHSDNFETAIERSIMIGGDTDTNTCIAAALYGACCGIKNIPTKWFETVVSAKPQRQYYILYNLLEIFDRVKKHAEKNLI